MPRRTTRSEEGAGELANDWLSTHTLRDIRELAQEMSEQGEDVTELVSAVNELEELLAETKVQDDQEASTA